MPCYDERNSPQYIEDHRVKPLQRKVNKLEAMLCGVLTVLEKDRDQLPAVLSRLDYGEIGISRAEFESWWKLHKEADERRRAAEREAIRNKQIKNKALLKLTAKERLLLGLKDAFKE